MRGPRPAYAPPDAGIDIDASSRARLITTLTSIGLEHDLTHGEAVTRAVSIVRELRLKLKDTTLPPIDDTQLLHIERFVLAAAKCNQQPIVVVTRAVGAWELLVRSDVGEREIELPRKREYKRWIDLTDAVSSDD